MNTTLRTQAASTSIFMPAPTGLLQRKCACGQHMVAGSKCAECRKKKGMLQRTAVNHHTPPATASPIVHEVLRSPGRPLDPATRAYMEPRFNHDFSKVRIHTNDEAAESTQVLNASAYTLEKDIVFGSGKYQPQTDTGSELLAHELTHVVQQEGISGNNNLLSPEIVHEHPLNVAGLQVYRQLADKTETSKPARNDVVIIVGRPSQTTPNKETRQDKINMQTWQAAARALAPHVYVGLTVDKAFAPLRKLKTPIGKLYIISHGDVGGIGEVNDAGQSVSTTVENVTKRIKLATKYLGNISPQSVEMLSCYSGGSPKTMGQIGKAVGASTVRAPINETVISGRIIYLNNSRLTRAKIAKNRDVQLAEYIKQTDALKYYDYVPGVPHPQPAPSKDDKLNALVGVLRRTGMLPFVGYNAEPGQRGAVPYWKAKVNRRKTTDELSNFDSLSMRGVIEITVQEKEKQPEKP